MKNKMKLGIALVAVIIAIGGYSFPQSIIQHQGSDWEDTGAIGTRFPNGLAVGTGASIATAGALVVGSGGANLQLVLKGTCNQLEPMNGDNIAATSTFSMDCAVTGVQSGDTVFVNLGSNATSTLNATSTNGGWIFLGAKASTTNGFISFFWANRIGKAAAIPSCSSAGNQCPTTYVSGLLSAAQTGLGSTTDYSVFR